jgi:hypothetical protein
MSAEMRTGCKGFSGEASTRAAVESGGDRGGHGVGCQIGGRWVDEAFFAVKRGLWGRVGRYVGNTGCASAQRGISSCVARRCLLTSLECLSFPTRFFLAITDGGI